MATKLRLLIFASFYIVAALQAQNVLFVDSVQGYSSASLDLGNPPGRSNDPTTIAAGNPYGSFSVANGPSSPQGGNAYFSSIVGPSSVLDQTFNLATLLDSTGNAASYVDGANYVIRFWYKPSLISDGAGNSWSFVPDSMFIATPSGVDNPALSMAINVWNQVDVPFVYDTATMTPASDIFVFMGAPSTPVLVSGTSTAAAQANYLYNGALDVGVVAVPEASGTLLLGCVGLLGFTRRQKQAKA